MGVAVAWGVGVGVVSSPPNGLSVGVGVEVVVGVTVGSTSSLGEGVTVVVVIANLSCVQASGAEVIVPEF